MEMDHDYAVRHQKAMTFLPNVHSLTYTRLKDTSRNLNALQDAADFQDFVKTVNAWCRWNTYFYAKDADAEIQKHYEQAIKTLGQMKLDKKEFSRLGRTTASTAPDEMMDFVLSSMKKCPPKND